MASIEEKVEEQFKKILDGLSVRHYGKTEKINDSIYNALKEADSKSGGSGMNYPDIQVILQDNARYVPVMIEAKGSKGKLEKTKDGEIVGITFYEKDGPVSKVTGKPTHLKGEPNYSAVKDYAVNGALHYGNAILDYGDYKEVIIIGINGTELEKDGTVKDPECRAYYVSKKNNYVPKHITDLDKSWALLSAPDKLYRILDTLLLTKEEQEAIKRKAETNLEQRVKAIHQSLYDDKRLKTVLSTNEKLYLFCGLIMAGLDTKGLPQFEVDELRGIDNEIKNDGTEIVERIKLFLTQKHCSDDKVEMILSLLKPVFSKAVLWRPVNGESVLKSLFRQIKTDIIPCLQSNVHLDFAGKILNSLNDWVHIENDKANDVVLTPRYVTQFMAKLAHTDMNSWVWDRAMGSAGFLVSAMDIMIKDAESKITDPEKLEEKKKHIKEKQLLGIEILGNIYILACLNMILVGDGSSNIINGDSHDEKLGEGFPATVFLLNPPYSAPGKGFNFVEEALNKMTEGYACILIQENAGAGQGLPYTKRILEHNTLLASIHMADIFCGKAGVQTSIYLFKVAVPHDKDMLVQFFDMSEDGYSRQNRRKSSQEVNLKDTDHAEDRYKEIEDRILGKKPKTDYYTEENGLYIKDTIDLSGTDWTFAQHKKIDLTPTEEDFKKTVAEYLSWRVSQIMKGKN